jgi:CRISPR-associated protein Cas2
MRQLFIVAYDVSDPKRLYRVHKRLLGFGEPQQYSIFLCLLSPKELILMMDAVEEVIKKSEDRIMVVNLGPEGKSTENRITCIGMKKELPSRSAIIV